MFENLEFVHGQIGEENDHVILDAYNKTRVVLVAAGNDTDMVTHREVFLELVGLELEWVLQVFVFWEHGDLVTVNRHDFAAQVDQLAFAHFDGVACCEIVRRFIFPRRYWQLNNPFKSNE